MKGTLTLTSADKAVTHLSFHMNLPERVKIVEVGPRDGLQNEKTILKTRVKAKFIRRLVESGLQTIEVASFVPPGLVPQMADSGVLLQSLPWRVGLHFPVLVPNMKGYENATMAGAAEMALISSASESFSRKNSGCSIAEGLQRCIDILRRTKDDGIATRGHISCSFVCPYEGEISPQAVLHAANVLYQEGCGEIVVADTVGRATPGKVAELIEMLARNIPTEKLAVHFHDTYGQALANILSAMQQGIATIDSSAAGLGGCPFAPGASGNVATEDLLFMLNGLGIHSGVDLDALMAAGNYICERLGRPNGSKVAAAVTACG